MENSSVLCVDIGTSSIKVAIVDQGKIQKKFINFPVAILFSKTNYYGVKAKAMYALEQHYNKTDVYIEEIFPLLDNVSSYNPASSQFYPFEIIESKNPKIIVNEYESYYPEEVIAMLLQEIINSLPEKYKLEDMKISLSNSEIAGCIAGLTGLKLLEPIVENTAIFHACLQKRGNNLDKPLLVFDFGVNGLKLHEFQNLNTCNSCTEKFEKFSSKELTTMLFNYVLSVLNLENLNQTVRNQIEEECEIAKIALSSSNEYKLQWKQNNLRQSLIVTRFEFESCIEQSLKRLVKFVKTVCSSYESDVVLIGGLSKIPAIRTRLKQIFPNVLNLEIEPEFVIAYGLAIHTTTTPRKYLY